jgi:hypothetical protein
MGQGRNFQHRCAAMTGQSTCAIGDGNTASAGRVVFLTRSVLNSLRQVKRLTQPGKGAAERYRLDRRRRAMVVLLRSDEGTKIDASPQALE